MISITKAKKPANKTRTLPLMWQPESGIVTLLQHRDQYVKCKILTHKKQPSENQMPHFNIQDNCQQFFNERNIQLC